MMMGLSIVDKALPLLIILAMIMGILISVYVPSASNAFEGATVVGVSIPLAIGLIIMMIPPLCKVEWENFVSFFTRDTYFKSIVISLILNWIVCPFLMFGLAWASLFDEPEYRVGVIMIGMARCIAMVLLWNEIAEGDPNLCAVLVLVNSLLQVVLYAPYQIFFCYVMTGDSANNSGLSYSLVAKSVAFFLGIPLALGVLVRFSFLWTVGLDKYKQKILPFISPWALIGLLYTIIVIFIEKGDDFVKNIGSAFRCFVPLVCYFMITWFGTFFLTRWLAGFLYFNGTLYRRIEKDITPTDETEKLLCSCQSKLRDNPSKWSSGCSANYSETITQTFTAASNNFELSLAVAISLYGSGSKQAIAATFGPLLEVPILLILAYVAKYFKRRFIWMDVESSEEIGVISVELE
jgi:ACR3 family arsenite transporter